MKRSWPAVAGLVVLAGCGELVGTAARTMSLSIVPLFNVTDPYAVAAVTTADSLRVLVIQKDPGGAFADTIARATAAIDPDSGTANTTINVPLLSSPQSFVIFLHAIRSADGAVLFSGLDTIQVIASSGGTADSIPIVYTGPRAARLQIAPKDTSLTAGSFAFRVTAFDSSDVEVSGVYVSFSLVNPTDSSRLKLGKYTGAGTVVSGASGPVGVFALAPGGVYSDTATVHLGNAVLAVRLTPGYVALAVGDTVTLVGQLLDAGGIPIGGNVTWQSRSPGIASVSATGRVSGVAPGAAVA